MRRSAFVTLLALGLSAPTVRALDSPPATASPVVSLPALIGTWTLVTVDNTLAVGTRVQPYGAKPQGLLTIDAGGRYAIQIYRPGRAPFAAADKSKGTPEEYRAAVEGSNTHFGTLEVDPTGHVLVFHITHASYPNWEGTEQRRDVVLDGDSLRYTVPVTTTGKGTVGEVTWRRLR